MSNLIKQQSVNLPKEVSQQSKSVYLANTSQSIRDISDMNIIVNSIHQSINRCIADKGVAMTSEDINYLYTSVREDILNDFSMLSLQDIQLCFKMGVRGKLGEYFGINAVSLYQWLKKYKEEILPQTFNEVSKFLPPAKEEEPKVDFKALDLEKIDNICNAILKFKSDSDYEFTDFGNIHYKFLERHGMFNLSSEQEEELKEEAKNLILSEAKNKNMDLLAQGKTFQMTDINKLFEAIQNEGKDIESVININYEKLILKNFIVNFISNKSNLEKFRNDLKKKIKIEHGK
jgi:hypothetical protein